MADSEFLVPFWEKKQKEEEKSVLRKVLFYCKLVFYFFSGFMIMWAFIQQMAASYTNYNQNPGIGFEFGYDPFSTDKTDDITFDLGSWSISGPRYHAFYKPTTIYGPFLSWFVYPVARAFIGLIYAFNQNDFLSESGLGVILAMLIIMSIMRFINFWPTLRSSIYTEKQLAHQQNLDAINAKYNKYDPNDRQAKLQKHQEISAYNKKHKLKPFAVLENFFISTPIFLIVFRVVTISRPIKFAVLFNLWDLSKKPFDMIFGYLTDPKEKGWLYLILCLIIIPVNFFSQKITTVLSRRRNPHLKKSDENKNSQQYKVARVQKVMTILFLLFTFFWSTSLAIYYFFNSIFTILQSILIHFILLRRKEKTNVAYDKLRKLGINV